MLSDFFITSFLSVPPDAITATVSRSVTARAGVIYSLTCNVSKTVDGLTNSPTATWTTEGRVVTNGNGIAVSYRTRDMITNSTLITFVPLRTSHEGRFVCSGTLTSPALDTALTSSATEDLEVQSNYTSIVYICIIYHIAGNFLWYKISWNYMLAFQKKFSWFLFSRLLHTKTTPTSINCMYEITRFLRLFKISRFLFCIMRKFPAIQYIATLTSSMMSFPCSLYS
jgi:hypothetical protein